MFFRKLLFKPVYSIFNVFIFSLFGDFFLDFIIAFRLMKFLVSLSSLLDFNFITFVVFLNFLLLYFSQFG